MKPLAIVLIIVCLAAFAGLGWLYFNSQFTVSFVSCVAADAADQADSFAALKKQLESGSFTGTRFTDAIPEDAGKHQFYTYTLRMNNRTPLPAEVVEIQITPMNGDVLQAGSLDEADVPSGESLDLTAVILTDKATQSIREAYVTWYFWGVPFSARVTCGR